MGKIRQPTIVAVILFTATLGLVGATVVAASLPSSGGNAAMASSQSALPAPSGAATTSKLPAAEPIPTDSTASAAEAAMTPPVTAKAKSPAGSSSRSRSITYTVKRGDTLSDIAAWFKQHGFKDLYEKNKKVIGSNPDIIRPGQRITVGQGGMKITAAH